MTEPPSGSPWDPEQDAFRDRAPRPPQGPEPHVSHGPHSAGRHGRTPAGPPGTGSSATPRAPGPHVAGMGRASGSRRRRDERRGRGGE
ncbi:hypothetical protein ACFU3E_10600 [Streptomyces sp. NPDC057424]|uniref:hypothetical protein n=1 Tax=Streptomyces sp. NPDC057424 TaxID=3346127 RepID=UPI0036A4E926